MEDEVKEYLKLGKEPSIATKRATLTSIDDGLKGNNDVQTLKNYLKRYHAYIRKELCKK